MELMVIEGGIYKDTFNTNVCFVYLVSDNDVYFGVDVKEIIKYSNDAINNLIKKYLQLEELNGLRFWHLKYPEAFKNLSDGYLGKVNQNIYQRLLIKLRESYAWKEYH